MEYTPFEKVQQFNRAFDVLPRQPITYKEGALTPFDFARYDIFTSDPAAVKLRVSLITEEIQELRDAYEVNDIIEIRDALADILYVIYGMADVFGVDMDLFADEYDDSHIHNHMLKASIGTYLDDINIYENKMVLNVESKDFKLIFDNLYKIILEVQGLYKFIGINSVSDFAIVHDSNMSKLCSNELEAAATVADYEAKFKVGTSPYDTPYYYHIPEINKWCVKNFSTGKVLKNINYIKVKFDDYHLHTY
jgi:predicted HAD superfamily Cof-like phosphohydrolase